MLEDLVEQAHHLRLKGSEAVGVGSHGIREIADILELGGESR